MQYSDPVSVNIAATDPGLADGLGATIVSGLPAGSGVSLPHGDPSTRTGTLSGLANLAPGTYSVPIRVSDGTDTGDTTVILHVKQEDTQATYTGAFFASTSSATSSTAIVTLSATIKDITAVDTSRPERGRYPQRHR